MRNRKNGIEKAIKTKLTFIFFRKNINSNKTRQKKLTRNPIYNKTTRIHQINKF